MCNPMNVTEIGDIKPDFMGFIYYKGSPRYVGSDPDKSLFYNVPPGITKTGVFVDEKPDEILRLSDWSGLGMIQLHGNESPDYCSYLRSSGLKIIKVFSIAESFDVEFINMFSEVCDYFLFDTRTGKAGGSGIKFDWNKLKAYQLDKPFFLSGGIGPEDAGLIKTFENRGFFAVDVNSRFETAPGIKNVTLVKTFIEALKNSGI
jgi:phosphoribosylanthranilate isomerase